MTDREIMLQAYDAIKAHLLHHEHGCVYLNPVMYALEAALAQPDETETLKRCLFQMQEAAKALAQPEREPVAWMMPDYGDVLSASEADGTGIYNIPLYTAPPRKEWVGLTDDEKNNCLVEADPCEALATPEAQELMREVEAKLKEKNGAI